MSGLATTKKLVEQLRVECNVNRMPMSNTVKEMITFIEQQKDSDPLIVGIDKKMNPFQEKSSCEII